MDAKYAALEFLQELDPRLPLVALEASCFTGNDDSHGLGHSLRVFCLALRLAKEEKLEVDPIRLALAALLHDIGRSWSKDHAEESAKLAREIMIRCGFPEDVVEEVCQAIREHSYSSGRKPSTTLSKLLSDADKLDAMGVTGAARTFMESAFRGRSLEESLKHFEEKLLRLHDHLETQAARKIGERRLHVLKIVYEELRRELEESRLPV